MPAIRREIETHEYRALLDRRFDLLAVRATPSFKRLRATGWVEQHYTAMQGDGGCEIVFLFSRIKRLTRGQQRLF